MDRRLSRGQIWLHSFGRPDKRRPVVVLTRDEAIPYLHTVMVAPITSTVRGLPSEVPVGLEHGLKHISVVNLDHVQSVSKKQLHHFVGSLGAEALESVCTALALAVGCQPS